MAEDSKNKVISTANLTIRGHLLKWSDTAIQISNISMVSTGDLPTPRFPPWTIIMLLVGLFVTIPAAQSLSASHGYFDNMTVLMLAVGLVLLSIGGGGFAAWLSSVQDNASQKYLHLFLNSGNIYSFVVRDQKFLQQMLQVFANIFESGTTSETNISINTQVGEIRENGVAVQLNVGK